MQIDLLNEHYNPSWDSNINEYSDGMAVYGHGLKKVQEAFHKFAIDKDGKQKDYISFEEWKQLFSDLFFSSNEQDFGNYLFGELICKMSYFSTKLLCNSTNDK
uniref:EF-hand domain-containing protein n=1 Tax=Panagrolaimus davidi TaxID=227884 RepID=A0A914QV97_9BILA